MDILEDLVSRLPTKPRDGMLQAVVSDYIDSDLGGELLIYARESYYPDEDAPQWWFDEPARGRWGARCTCTACREDFWAGWIKGGGVAMVVGDDGSAWPGIPDKESADVVGWTDENDDLYCPRCGTSVHPVHRKKLRNCRTYQLMAGSIEHVGDLAVAMSWIVSRRVDEFGVWDMGVQPFGAMVLLPNGRMKRYMHETVNAYGGMNSLPDWRPVNSRDDPYQIKYYSHEATNSRKFGVAMWKDLPELAGSTAEKTGLAEYIRAGGEWPVVYLDLWRERPAVENLMKCGMARMIVGRIDDCVNQAANYGFRKTTVEVGDLADWNFKKPREMLHFTKEEVAACGGWRWTADIAALWMEGVNFGLWVTGCAGEFHRLLGKFGKENISRYVGEVTDGYDFEPLPKWEAYLEKQLEKHGLPRRNGFGLLIDYRKELAEQVDAPGAEELWPRDLRAAHDRIFAAKKQREDKDSIANFLAVAKKWAALEWSDGEICIRLPRCNGDLVREGHVLHHCVGGYGKQHLTGNLILFVRHARRPERSWFTLNISVTKDKPTRIQLHGYGNEWAHGEHLTIPQRVLDFVDRWETEILLPVFRQVRAAELAAKSAGRKRGAA